MTSDFEWVWQGDDSLSVAGVVIPHALHHVWRLSVNLRDAFDLDEPAGRAGLLHWWLRHGQVEFPGLRLPESHARHLLTPDPLSLDSLPFPIPRLAHVAWTDRADLRAHFDLDDEQGQLAFLGWWVAHGVGEYKDFLSISDWLDSLALPASGIVQDQPLPVCRMAMFHARTHPDCVGAFDIRSAEGRRSLLGWFCSAREDAWPAGMVPDSWQACLAGTVSLHEGSKLQVPAGLAMLLDVDASLARRFPLDTVQGGCGLLEWWQAEGQMEYPGFHGQIRGYDLPGEKGTPPDVGTFRPGGVNIIGLPRGELGVGEDARMASAVLEQAGIPCSVITASVNSASRMEDDRHVRHLADGPVYGANLICLPAPDLFISMVRDGFGMYSGRYNIGAWPWELPRWPERHDFLFSMVDEVWASSTYTAQAFHERGRARVVHMPLAVHLGPVPDVSRSGYGLPGNRFLFLFTFDGLSFLARKNPLLAVRAFRKAFPRQDEEVGLVLKCMNLAEESDLARALRREAAEDNRVVVLDRTMRYGEVMGLFKCCDAYVSLHRAEGFGRTMAEAMLLGKPVIATAFSGNMDFTTEDTAFLVRGPLVPVARGEYHFSEGQYWCDPDLEEAAAMMRLCREDETLRRDKAARGQHRIRTEYGLEAVSRRYAERLQEIGILD